MTPRPSHRHNRPTNRPSRSTNPSETLPAKILEHLEALNVAYSREQLDHVLHQAEQNARCG